MSRYLRKKYMKLEAYVPGEQPKDMAYTKLNTNESPYPPGPRTIKAVSNDEVARLRLYSDPDSTALKDAIAKRYGMEGTNLPLYQSLSEKYDLDIVASGGVSTMDDVRKLKEMGVFGAIIGKALYSGAIDLREAIEEAR